MQKLLSLRSASVMALTFLGACAESPLGPTALPERVLAIDGLPAGQRLRVGQNVLVSLSVPDAVSVRWTADGLGVVSVTATAAVSPCGQGCAWITASGPGAARIRATVFFADGSHAEVTAARVCGVRSTEDCQLLPAELTVS